MPNIINYKGVKIRQYGTCPGESVYPLCFTDDLDNKSNVKMHDSLYDAKVYINAHVNPNSSVSSTR